MHCVKKVTDNLYWLGGNDRTTERFESVYNIPEGVSYNSYLLFDGDKTVLFDTVDFSLCRQFLDNIAYLLDGKKLDYIVVNHMEPDHAASLEFTANAYPEATIVCNDKIVKMIGQFFDGDFSDRFHIVAEGDSLTLNDHVLNFVMAPMVHWPEVMMTYDSTNKTLFSADAFGTFGTLNGKLFNDEFDFDRDFLDSARRYYCNIVGKYGKQVQNVLKKAATLDIQRICPLHGPVWRSDLGYFIEKHDLWSSYKEEKKGIVIVYTTMYGGTQNMAEIFAAGLNDRGITEITMFDAAKTHPSYLIAEVFKYSHFAIASPTYNGNIHPLIETWLTEMDHLSVQNKTVALMENGSWAPASGKKIKAMLENMKNIDIVEPTVSIKSTLKEEQNADMEALLDAVAATLK